MRRQGSFSSLERSRTTPSDRHKTRYLRNLGKVLLIDEAQAQAVYSAAQAASPRSNQLSWGLLLRTFYQQEVDKAKGTQVDHARSLALDAPKPSGPSPSPTFSLPDWSSGQPPQGGVHFSTLKEMTEAYEKFERQTNYQTAVTFKSMIKPGLRPTFESKCKLPRTVWKNPEVTDAIRVEAGKSEEGRWSDLRFLAAVRRALAPIGRTSYEIAFEKMRLYHRGTDTQLAVTLSVWGEKWLAKEREAEDQSKTLPVPKMKILFKAAVSSVAKFKRWLEARVFTSSSDWFQYLSRKLHKSLGKSQEDEHDNRDTRQDRSWEGRGGGEPWRGSSRGGGETRGDSGTSRGGGPAGESYRQQRGSSQSYRGHSGGSRVDSDGRDAQGLSSYRFAPPGRANHMSGGYDGWRDGEQHAEDEHGDRYQWQEGHDEEYGEDGRLNGLSAQGHSGGAEPMVYSPSQSRGRGGFRGGRGGGEARSPRKPVNDPSEDTAERLAKGVRWHDSAKQGSQCRDADCGTRQDVPFCQGCGMHGHDRPFCFKCLEAAYNATGYWDKNRPNQPPIQGLRGIRRDGDPKGSSAATARGNIMDATPGSY